MTSSLPHLLTSADLPLPELQAAALDGDVYRLDRVFSSVAEFDLPWRRAAALAAVFGREFVVARTSAAWVWGALAVAPPTHEGYRPEYVPRAGFGPRLVDGAPLALGSPRAETLPSRRWRDSPVGMSVSEVVLDVDDVVDFGAVRVTSAVRTVVDLVRAEAWSAEIAATVLGLCSDHHVGPGRLRRRARPSKESAAQTASARETRCDSRGEQS